MLPTGQAIAFNGANRDDVVLPGSSHCHRPRCSIRRPAGGPRWNHPRSAHAYHNSAVLLPSGQILVGGNAPIDAGYPYSQTLPGGFSNDFRDPSFQVYDPPYLKWGIPQPRIGTVADNGHVLSTNAGLDDVGYRHRLTITSPDAATIKSVVLVRNPAQTHVVDGDQRSVEVPLHGSR